MTEEKAKHFMEKYSVDISDYLIQEITQLKAVHDANFGAETLPPFNLLNNLCKHRLQTLFPNVCTALRIFCTMPVTVAEAERSFSKLKLIKSYLRSTMTQGRLSDLGILSI
jgi:hypothetical protein